MFSVTSKWTFCRLRLIFMVTVCQSYYCVCGQLLPELCFVSLLLFPAHSALKPPFCWSEHFCFTAITLLMDVFFNSKCSFNQNMSNRIYYIFKNSFRGNFTDNVIIKLRWFMLFSLHNVVSALSFDVCDLCTSLLMYKRDVTLLFSMYK